MIRQNGDKSCHRRFSLQGIPCPFAQQIGISLPRLLNDHAHILLHRTRRGPEVFRNFRIEDPCDIGQFIRILEYQGYGSPVLRICPKFTRKIGHITPRGGKLVESVENYLVITRYYRQSDNRRAVFCGSPVFYYHFVADGQKNSRLNHCATGKATRGVIQYRPLRSE